MTHFSKAMPGFTAVCLLFVTGCGGNGGGGSWFNPAPPDTLEPEGGYGPVIVDQRALVSQVTSLRGERTPGGLIIVAEGLPPFQGYWDVDLVQVTGEDIPASELRYEFRVRPPGGSATPGTVQSRDLEAAAFATNAELAGISRITVLGAQGSRSIRR